MTVTDPRAIRALTNPVRFRAMEELYSTQRQITASELARTAGVLPGSMTYHLTVLEGFGLVVRADPDGSDDRRERPWAAAGPDYTVVGSGGARPSDAAVLLDQYLHDVTRRMQGLLRRYATGRPAQLGYVVATTARIVLDAEERRAMRDEVEAVWRKYQAMAAGRVEDEHRRTTRILWTVLPDDEDDLGPDVLGTPG